MPGTFLHTVRDRATGRRLRQRFVVLLAAVLVVAGGAYALTELPKQSPARTAGVSAVYIDDLDVAATGGDKGVVLNYNTSPVKRNNGSIAAGTRMVITVTKPDASEVTFKQSTDQDGRIRGQVYGAELNQDGVYGLEVRVDGTSVSDSANFTIDERARLGANNQIFTGNNQIFRNAADSATAFAVQQADGTEVLGVDTTGGGEVRVTDLDASGTVAAAGFSGDGSALTDLDASNITSGTLADARLSPNVALLDASNVFTAANRFTRVSGSSRAVEVQAAGDANARFASLADGRLFWSDGTGSLDTNLYREDVDELRTDDTFRAARVVAGTQQTGSGTIISGRDDVGGTSHVVWLGRDTNNAGAVIRVGGADDQSLTAPVLTVDRDGEAERRFELEWSGRMLWGDGASPADTNLYRDAAGNTLKTDDTFDAAAYEVGGVAGASASCGAGEVYENQDVSSGLVTGGSCSSVSGLVSLQDAYDNGNVIAVGDAAPVVIENASGSSTGLQINDSSGLNDDTPFISFNNGAEAFGIRSSGTFQVGPWDSASQTTFDETFEIDPNGEALFEPVTDSEDAFSVVSDSDDQKVLGVDTTNKMVGINVDTPETEIQVGGPGLNDSEGRISFGDYDEVDWHGVMVGEFGSGDTDQLQLQGANGVEVTTGDIGEHTIIDVDAGTGQTEIVPITDGASFIVNNAADDETVFTVDTANSRLGVNDSDPDSRLDLQRPDIATEENGLQFSTTNGDDWKVYQPTGSNDLHFWNDDISQDVIELDTSGEFTVHGESTNPAAFNRNVSDGTIVSLQQGATEEGTISVSGNTVSYNAFTGSHYADAQEEIEAGMLVTLTGRNGRLDGRGDSEILYGVKRSVRENDPGVMGAYLAVLNPKTEENKNRSESASNPSLVMAVGNGEVWVADDGKNLEPGDALVSAGVPGHAVRDPEHDPVSHVIAKVAEPVAWDEVDETVDADGKKVKHRKVSVFFTQFDKPNRGGGEELREVEGRVERLERKLDELAGGAALSPLPEMTASPAPSPGSPDALSQSIADLRAEAIAADKERDAENDERFERLERQLSAMAAVVRSREVTGSDGAKGSILGGMGLYATDPSDGSGTVDGVTGDPAEGDGFTAKRTAKGVYAITFADALPGIPSPTVTPKDPDGVVICSVHDVTEEGFVVKCQDVQGRGVDQDFTFRVW